MRFSITLVIFRFDPSYRKQIECAFIQDEPSEEDEGSLSLPNINLNDGDEPKQIILELLQSCLLLDTTWASPKIVDLVKKSDGTSCDDCLTCVYTLNVPNTVISSNSIRWIAYDKLEEMVQQKTQTRIVRRSYHAH